MTLSLTILGCSGTYAGPNGACSGYLVRSDTTTVWMDAGPGTLANLQHHVQLDQIDAVVLSHEHPDHWLELPVLRNALKYSLGIEGLPVFATAGTLALAEPLCSGALDPTFVPNVIADGTDLMIGDLRLRCARTDHPVETMGIRIDSDGRSLGYTADTGPGWSLAELGDGLDLGLSEATFLHHQIEADPVHLSARQAGELARAAGVRRLVLTHLLPSGSGAAAAAEASDAYGAPVEIATTHQTFQL